MITLHATNHPGFVNLQGALRRADAVVVHRQEEFVKLVGCGVENAVVQRQGIHIAVGHKKRSADGHRDPVRWHSRLPASVSFSRRKASASCCRLSRPRCA